MRQCEFEIFSFDFISQKFFIENTTILFMITKL